MVLALIPNERSSPSRGEPLEMGAWWGADRGVVRQKVRHLSGATMEETRSATGSQPVGNKAPNILVECEAAVGILGKPRD